MSKPCEECTHIVTCMCPRCERAFCTEHDAHIHELTVKEIADMECFEKRDDEEVWLNLH